MTHGTRPAARAALAAAAAFALAGCSGTHVGESWQCPLAQGASCASIADADPAVPKEARGDSRAGPSEAALALGTPLTRSPELRRSKTARDESLTKPACETGCGPFAWVARWLGIDEVEGAQAAGAETVGVETTGGPGATGVPPGPPPAPKSTESAAASAGALPASAVAPDAALREAEVIGRIWIAPFVDGAGVYREGAWVRAVLEPAAWRRP